MRWRLSLFLLLLMFGCARVEEPHPASEVIFVPQPTDATTPQQPTSTLFIPTATLTVEVVDSADTPTSTVTPPTTTPSPSPTTTPLPTQFTIADVPYQTQHGYWNYCGPANVAMQVSYWGEQRDRTDAGAFMRGSLERIDDKNVSMYEMVAYVEQETALKTVVRYGGTLEMLQQLVAQGFPTLIEKGYEPDDESDWMGHYLLVTGYDDGNEQFVAQDSYIGADTPFDYAKIESHWRAFNFVFMVAYPEAREAEVLAIVGDAEEMSRAALMRAEEESAEFTHRDQFFAYFNLGTSLTTLGDYAAASSAFDSAFTLYPEIPQNERPWRMMWYQFAPYQAYYEIGRYEDVINLANTTLQTLDDPILEESFYWRGKAKIALGDQVGGEEDLRRSAELNPNFLNMLER